MKKKVNPVNNNKTTMNVPLNRYGDKKRMEEITLDKKELYDLVKRAVREVLEEELFQLRLERLPFVSDEEMREIEKEYGKPQVQKNLARTENLQI